MTILTDWPIQIGMDDILRGQGADPKIVRAEKPVIAAAAECARQNGICLLHPVTLIREIAVREHRHEKILLENDGVFTGPLVAHHLNGSQRVVVAICTIGSELENMVTRLLSQDPLFAMGLDGLGNAAVDILAQQVCAQIEEAAMNEGLTASTPLSPGSPEWPVEIGQPQVFSLVDANQVGVKFTSAGMMIPKKSMSFIIGIGPDMSKVSLCDMCSLKGTCRYKHG